MSDIVEILRAQSQGYHADDRESMVYMYPAQLREAADEIERLSSELSRVRYLTRCPLLHMEDRCAQIFDDVSELLDQPERWNDLDMDWSLPDPDEPADQGVEGGG